MKFGVSMFCTDFSMRIDELAQAVEERRFESLWLPEHSHIPKSRKSPWPGGPNLPKWNTAKDGSKSRGGRATSQRESRPCVAWRKAQGATREPSRFPSPPLAQKRAPSASMRRSASNELSFRFPPPAGTRFCRFWIGTRPYCESSGNLSGIREPDRGWCLTAKVSRAFGGSGVRQFGCSVVR